ncbi:NUDIX domain-containing protein [Modestobacter sp. DSM 44400]|nr:NUDIX domain-containing protein [Modestobacter sp. DSM 44400]
MAALRREIKEELGVQVVTVDPEPLIRIRDAAADLHLGIWVVRRWTGTPVNRCAEEHDELRWVSQHDLPALELAHPSYAALLAGLLSPWAAPEPDGVALTDLVE